jgi:Lipopolysaccharide kinase (Kdo/WaaP) family.
MSAARPIDRFEPVFEAQLAQAGLGSFDDFWQFGGHREQEGQPHDHLCGAARAVRIGDQTLSLSVKRQENHCFRSLLHPLRGQPTFWREWRLIHRLRAGGVPTFDPVYYGERKEDGRHQAVLVTLALDEFRDLNRGFAERGDLSETQRANALQLVALVLLRFHRNRLRHNNLIGDHVVLRFGSDGRVGARLLGLEQVTRARHPLDAAARDLAHFIRHTPTLCAEDHQALVRAYAQMLPALVRKALVQTLNQVLRAGQQRGGMKHPPIVLE